MSHLIPPAILEFLTPHRLFSRLSIANKMFLGYAMLAVLTLAVVAYALASLSRINRLNDDIVMEHVPVQEAADRMLDALNAQDTYEKRYLVVPGETMRGLFQKRGKEFAAALAELRDRPPAVSDQLEAIANLHAGYEQLFDREVRLIKQGDAATIQTGNAGSSIRLFKSPEKWLRLHH